MSEPKRWVLVEVEPAAIAVWPDVSPEAQAAIRSPMPTRTVREDRATDADREAIYNEIHGYACGCERPWPGSANYEQMVQAVADAIFGEGASRV